MDFHEVLTRLYEHRFDAGEMRQRHRIWKVLCDHWFKKFIPYDSSVLDIGSGSGEFINQIECKEKFAVDSNDANKKFLSQDVKFYLCQSVNLSCIPDGRLDVVFMSNFLEHLLTKEEFARTIVEANRVLKPKGKLLILGPNIKYVYRNYWDFFDHHIPLSHYGLVELLEALGFSCELVLAKFLPYTVKSHIPKFPFLVRLYLAVPLVWKFMGRQMFIVARKC